MSNLLENDCWYSLCYVDRLRKEKRLKISMTWLRKLTDFRRMFFFLQRIINMERLHFFVENRVIVFSQFHENDAMIIRT